jgi:hypothetical protein
MNKLAKEEVAAWDAWLACYTPHNDGVPCGHALSAMHCYLAADGVRLIADEETIAKVYCILTCYHSTLLSHIVLGT